MKQTIFTIIFLVSVLFCSCVSNNKDHEIVVNEILNKCIYEDSVAISEIDYVYDELVNGRGKNDLDIAAKTKKIATERYDIYHDKKFCDYTSILIKEGYDINKLHDLKEKHDYYHNKRFDNEKRDYIIRYYVSIM